MESLLQTAIEPDFEALRSSLRREKEPSRVHFMEFYLDRPVEVAVVERFGLDEHLDKKHPFYYLQERIALQQFLGYDMVKYEGSPVFVFEKKKTVTASGTETKDGLALGPIQNWNDFEQYPWPKVSDVDFSPLDFLEKELPVNMKCYLTSPIGYYKMLFGYEAMYYMMYDDPVLFKAVLDRLQGIFIDYARRACQYSCVGAVWASDDMGMKTQTFFPPEFMRETILPMHQAFAAVAHAYDKLYFLHACGNLEAIMNDLIDTVKIDAKHSFENAIVPVTEMKKRYGSRVSLLGGLDVDVLCRSDEKSLRKHVRDILDVCHPGGGYCLGSGNSIAGYVPLENYLIMLDEGRLFAR